MLRRNTNYILLAIVLDILGIFIAITIANWLRTSLDFGMPLLAGAGVATLALEAGILYPVVFLLFAIYDPERTFRAVDEYQILSIASFISALALAGLIYFTAREISRLFLVYFYCSHFAVVVAWRGFARVIQKQQNIKGIDVRRVLLIGGGEAARQALERLHELSWAGIHLVGYLTDGQPIPSANGDIPLLGSLKDAERLVHTEKVDDVLLALPAENYNKVQQLVTHMIDIPCNIWVVQDYFSLLIYGARVEDLGGVPMISLKPPALTGYQRVVKRAFDLVVGSLLMLIALPLMGIIALIIRLDSSGAVIFKQIRVGEGGKLFWIYKFRTMVSDADQRIHEVIQHNHEGKLIHKYPNDPRVTKFGRLLRRTSLDELPQFLNVLKGDMSIVGPRPELPILVEEYEPWQLKRFAVPQGITGWWQVNGRSDKPMHLHTEDDLYYIQNYSLLLDLQIILKTVWTVLRSKGAY